MHATEHPIHFDFSQLSVPERIALAQRLWESVREQVEAMPLTETEMAEVRWRIDQIDAGLMVCERFDTALARAARG
jgi:putative addiction module component (TIGR02574 family)